MLEKNHTASPASGGDYRSYQSRGNCTMKSFAIVVVAGILMLIVAALGYYWLVPKQAGGGRAESAPHLVEKTTTFSIHSGGAVAELEYNGKKLRFAIGGEDAKDVDLKLVPSITWKDGQPDATIQVTIRKELPLVLTKASYEKIQKGMTYPQVGELLGGALAKGEMSDGFSSRLQFIQGKHQCDVKFVDGKITEKSAKDLD
jgi:hypothetical protein